MEIRQLEAFTTVMTAGSITRAAKLLNRSQSVITRHIQDLEAELGYDLLQRHGPRIKPTELAFLLYEEAAHIVSSVRRIRNQAKDGRPQEQPLQITAISALAVGLLPRALATNQSAIAMRKVRLRTAPPEKVINDVLHHVATLGLCSLPLDHYGVQVHWIAEMPCVAVLRENDPLATQADIGLAELSERSLIGMDNPFRMQHRLNEALDGRLPDIATTTSIQAQVLVREGLGVAVLEPFTPLGAPLPGLTYRPLKANLPFFFGVLTPHGLKAPAIVTQLIESMRTIASSLPGCRLHAADQHARLANSLHA